MRQVEQLGQDELRGALEILLAVPAVRRPASRGHIDSFRDYLVECPVEWLGLRCGPKSAPTALLFALLLPGRTAIVMIPTPGELGIDPGDQRRLMDSGLVQLGRHRLYYAQTLLEPELDSKRELVEQAGFELLAPLVYLERDAKYPWADPPPPEQAEWITYDAGTHAQFEQVVLATYADSRDCPELTGIRPMADVLAAHKASGRFDPALWELLRVSGQTAGCLLLAHLVGGTMLEVVYMGVTAEYRRRGLGKLLIRRALEQCRRVRARQLTVVVDGRNEPARRLYARFALVPVARREAFLYRWGRT